MYNGFRYTNKKYNKRDIKKSKYSDGRNQIVKEAIEITRELENIAFVGAIAVYFHTESDRSRSTHDIDLVAATPLPNDYLEGKGYTILEERKKEKSIWTRRGFHIDILSEDVGEIPVQHIINTAKSIPRGKREEIVKVANIEVLIVTKYRANRPQDGEDLYAIAKTKFSQIDWSSLESLTKSDYEFQDIKTTMYQYYRSNDRMY